MGSSSSGSVGSVTDGELGDVTDGSVKCGTVHQQLQLQD